MMVLLCWSVEREVVQVSLCESRWSVKATSTVRTSTDASFGGRAALNFFSLGEFSTY